MFTFQALALAGLPALLLAHAGGNPNFPDGPPLRVTGAPVDGGAACTACHAGQLNSGPGRVVIRSGRYTLGKAQRIQVDVRDPDASRWGFELVARLASDETKQAGSFRGGDLVRVRCDGGTPHPINTRLYGTPPPCGEGVLQFASHTLAGTLTGARGGTTWEFEWTPPATDLGPVVFYAAANAANNSGNSQGDRIYATSTRVAGLCNLSTTPRITGVSNAAAASTTISPNSLISLFGSGFGAADEKTAVADSDLLDGKVPTDLGCLAVEVNGRRAPIYYAQADQINAQAPILEGTGSQQVRVILNPGTANERRSDAAPVNLQFYSPAWFLTAPNNIAARAADGKILGDPALIAGAVSAKPGDVVSLFGTGFGYTNPVWQPGEFSEGEAPLRDPYTITLGGTRVSASDILYAGLTPAFPGFYQVNLRIPANAPDGLAVVILEIGGLRTQTGAGILVRR
ncbi:MAG: choice-of-anchor V domain-containing protein [Bryobacteraceae bacterium]